MTRTSRLIVAATAVAAAGILAYLVTAYPASAGPKAPTTDQAAAEGKTAEDLAKEKADEERRARARRRRLTDTRPLYYEGANVIDVVGYVMCMQRDLHVPDAPRRSVLQPVDGSPYMVLLECKHLERLEKITRHGEKLVRVSGSAYVYENRNYLLLSRVQVKLRRRPD
jgi:hypothetical protein